MKDKIDNIIRFLEDKGIVFDNGLTQDEFDELKIKFGVDFPPDLKLLLSRKMPISKYFPDWRKLLDGSDSYLKESLTHPEEGIIFDIEYNNFWYPRWGTKPKELSEALKTAREELEAVPKLARVYSHRYIPVEPLEEGNPIFSISQTDIIYYGNNLENFFHTEFNKKEEEFDPKFIKRINFWSDLVDLNNGTELETK